MTKDWDSVRETIRRLSVDQKKSLEEVKDVMESKHQFRASTRAYRMKLKEWGYLRHRPRRTAASRSEERDDQQEDDAIDLGEESTAEITPDQAGIDLLEEAQDLLPAMMPSFDPLAQARSMTTDLVMEMLSIILEGDSQKLEPIIQANPQLINLPIGLPFEAHGGRFFNHPAMQQCVILQHPEQTLFDIACALPSVPTIWVMQAYGAKGSTHPLGTDLALHNAIKNGRTFVVQALLHSGGSNANGLPGTSWKPLLQATFWNMPDIVRLLLDKGASVDDTAPPFIQPFKTALQFALDRRANEYLNQPVRERCEKIIKMLLDAGANIHVAPIQDPVGLTAFEMFIKPWQSNTMWAIGLTQTVIDIFEAFVRKGADLQTQFCGFRCSARSGSAFEHQVLWHSSPSLARLLIDHAAPTPTANGCNMLHEIVGYCPEAKRHPSDTLRDIEVLIQRGANPNWQGKDGSTPLTTCIESCPGVDIIDRVKLLLDKGADPEMPDANGLRPVVLAARGFEEPNLSKVMHLLVSKFRGRHSTVDQYAWGIDYFPIANEPSFARVLRYSNQNGDFETNLQRMLPKAAIPAFRKAAFSVASENFLNYVTKKRITNVMQETQVNTQERDEIMALIRLRQDKGIADYQFNQHFVLSLMASPFVANLPLPLITNRATVAGIEPPQQSSSASSTTTIVPIQTSSAPQHTDTFYPDDPNTCPIAQYLGGAGPPEAEASTTPTALSGIPASIPRSSNINTSAQSPDSTTSHESASSWFVPETTTIRFPSLGDGSDADLEKAIRGMRNLQCKSCGDGRMMGKKEYQRHEAEHWHTVTCKEMGCRRRFCVAERG